MGMSHEVAHGSLRITLGRDNTEEDVSYFLQVLPEIVEDQADEAPTGADRASQDGQAAGTPVKRKRGRPRRNPIPA